MGLKEKQAIANLDFSSSIKHISQYTGKGISIELDTDSFSSDLDAILYTETRGAQAVANGIAKVCYNEIGKEAFNEKKISRIVLKNQAPGNRFLKINDGTLTMAFAFSGSDDYYSENEIKEEIENQL